MVKELETTFPGGTASNVFKELIIFKTAQITKPIY